MSDHPADRPDAVTLLGREPLHDGHFQMNRYHLRHATYAGDRSVEIRREVFERGHGVCVLPYDPVSDRLVLIEQFRIAPYICEEPAWLIEVIAGVIDPGETPEDVARREAEEEAGVTLAGPLEPISRFYVSPGGTSETLILFCASGPLPDGVGGVHGLAEEGEDIRVLVPTFDQAMTMLAEGRIVVGPAIVSLQWLALNRDRLREGLD
ncbi:MAG: NUDIX domain-containing protein [Alphaproteobacteria bacterium]